MAGAIRIKDKEGRTRQFSLEEALAEASRDFSKGDHGNALLILEKAIRAAPFDARARHLLGMSQANAGKLQDAIYNLTKAVEADPQNVDYRAALAHALMVEKPSAAIPHFFAAIQLGATSVTVFGYLASILLDLGRAEEALQVCDQGLVACPEKAGMEGARAVVLRRLARLDESLACSQRQLELQPDGTAAWCNLGVTLLALGNVAESEEALRRACALGPQNGEAHYNLALNLLLQGQYQEGFREYEWRWKTAFVKGHAKIAEPLWDGSPLGTKRLLLHAEQGAGDSIQLARYLPLVAKLGGQIFLAVPPQLVRLMKLLDGPFEVTPPGIPVGGIDTHCPLLSLPLLFGTQLDSIPLPASFNIPADLLELWARRVAGPKPKVGLVWAGSPGHLNDRNRSLPLRSFLPLLALHEIDFFSLQLGPRAQELATEVTEGVRDLSPFLSDYAETAAAISCLDLVISVDTSVAHLAASLGKPVWLLVPFAPDWRWMLGRQDSPWYPSVRLFRQKTRGDWQPAMSELQTALSAWLPSIRRTPAIATRESDSTNPPNNGAARAELAAGFIPAGATVLDLGCGAMPLELFLPYGCGYIPCDRVKRDERTILCDFNKDSLAATTATHMALLGQLETIHDWRGFLKQLCAFKRPLVLSYHPTDFLATLDRAAQGWVNHLSLEDLCAAIYEAGFLVQSSLRFENQILMRIQPGLRSAARTPRVLVLTYNNTGNFGDRLGFHLINSILPAAAEVHYATFDPWRIPPGDFDLLVLGAGNSIFERVLTEDLLSLVRKIPQAVGIFGTQYRQEINQARFTQLLDSLKVWFARSEEDILLYGKGRANAIHLGDWLIDAFPLTRWTHDETLEIGKEIFGELPLDRTIQQIQRYRSVVSERLHPFLCALTSAERVAYKEQQDTGSGRSSGKFRGLLLDIFGRTWPESTLFEFRRECVADYKTRVRAIVSGMPLLFEELLQTRRS